VSLPGKTKQNREGLSSSSYGCGPIRRHEVYLFSRFLGADLVLVMEGSRGKGGALEKKCFQEHSPVLMHLWDCKIALISGAKVHTRQKADPGRSTGCSSLTRLTPSTQPSVAAT